MAPRAVWTGSITVGLLDIPVKLISAVRQKTIAFNQLEDHTAARIRYQKVAEATGEPVDSSHIVKGYDLGGGHYAIVDDAELAKVAPAKTKEIGLDTFVPVDQIPVALFEKSYLLLPGKNAKPYRLFAEALAGTDRAGIGRFVMRQKEYLCMIRSDGQHLMLTNLAFPDELVDPAAVDDLDIVEDVKLTDRELALADTLVEALADRFDPEQYRDTYRDAVMGLIEAKAAGKVFVTEPAEDHAVVVDLAAALQASVEAAKASRSRHPTARQHAASKSEATTPKQGRKKSA